MSFFFVRTKRKAAMHKCIQCTIEHVSRMNTVENVCGICLDKCDPREERSADNLTIIHPG